MKNTLLLAAAFLMMPAAALATPCQSDADCDEDESCAMILVDCPPCEPGAECPDCVGEDQGECVPDGGGEGDDYFWSGTECETDADCPDSFVCSEYDMPCGGMEPACVCEPCASGESCEPCDCGDAPEPPDCSDTTMKSCVFMPTECSSDADCDANFACIEDKVCSGGGSVGCDCATCACAPCDGPDCEPCDCPSDPEPCTCDEEPVFEESCEVVGAYCGPKELPCQADSDCPESWECAKFGVMSTCDACACAEGQSCECAPCENTQDEEGYCLPGGWGDLVTAASDAGGQGGGSAATGNADILLGEAAPHVGTPKGGDGTGGGAGGPADPNTQGTGGTGGTAGVGGTGTGSGSNGGCAVASDATTGFAVIFGILLVIFAVLTRRSVLRDE